MRTTSESGQATRATDIGPKPRSGYLRPLAIDTSALLTAVIAAPTRAFSIDVLERHDAWFASDLALSEAIAAVDRLTEEPLLRSDLEDALRTLFDYCHTVPVDRRCLDDAANIARRSPVPICHAIHLAAAMRIPSGEESQVRLLTFDASQFAVAESLGLQPVGE